MTCTWVKAGLLIRNQIRSILIYMKCSGKIQDYVETKGWIESTFIITGTKEQIISFERYMNDISQSNNSD